LSSTLITGLATFIIGSTYTLLSLNLPRASIGRPNEPKIFPILLGVLMILLSFGLIAQEFLKRGSKKKTTNKKAVLKYDTNTRKIILTVLNALLYSFLFLKAGYLVSTFIFVGLELILFGGLKRWKSCALIAFFFSFTIYVLFNKLLGVYLPPTPYIGI